MFEYVHKKPLTQYLETIYCKRISTVTNIFNSIFNLFLYKNYKHFLNDLHI